MVTQFVLRTDKKDNAGRCHVHLVVYFDGIRLKSATGEKCKPADWNADKQKFRASYPLAEEANDLLKRLAADVLGWWRGAELLTSSNGGQKLLEVLGEKELRVAHSLMHMQQ